MHPSLVLRALNHANIRSGKLLSEAPTYFVIYPPEILPKDTIDSKFALHDLKFYFSLVLLRFYE